MKILKAFVYKLKLNKSQETVLNSWLGSNRFVWNKALKMSLERLEKKLPLFWYDESAFWLKLWKTSDELAFLKDSPSQTLQQTLMDLSKAWKDGFDKKQPLKRIPRFKKKNHDHGFRFPQGFKIEGNQIKLPKIGWLRFRKSRELEGVTKNVTVKKKADGWYISVQIELSRPKPCHPETNMVGVDRGIEHFAVLSDGSFLKGSNSFKTWENKLAIEQKKLKNKKKFSSNWKKQQHQIGMLHQKIAACRKDRLQWLSTQISKNHAIIVLEALKVKNMSKSAKGTSDKPGKNVNAKSGLNKRILDQGWSMFKDMLMYKQSWLGGQVIEIPAKHTSQRCCVCGHTEKTNRESQSLFVCKDCGHTDNADLNAAKNILTAGHAVLACESNHISGRKQELVETSNRIHS